MKPLIRALWVGVVLTVTVAMAGPANAQRADEVDRLLNAAGVQSPVGQVEAAPGGVKVADRVVQVEGTSPKASMANRLEFAGTSGTTHVAQGTGDGMQLLAVLHDRTAAKSVSYNFPGMNLLLEDNGAVTVRDANGNNVGAIASPWAKDANGTSLKTSYQVKGSRLVQTIKPTKETAYPVVADPFYWWGYAFNLTRSQTLTATTSTGACALFTGWLPHWAFKIASGYCGVIALYANHIYSQGKCLNVHVYYTGQIGWSSRWC